MSGIMPVLGIVALVVALVFVQLLRSMLTWPFPAQVRLRVLAQAPPPAAFAPLFARSHSQLSDLDFSALGWTLIGHEPEGTPGPRLARLYLSDDGQVLAQVIAPWSEQEPHACRIHLVSQCRDGRLLFTAPTVLSPLPTPPELAVTQMTASPSLDEQVQAHRELLAAHDGAISWSDLAAAGERLQAYENAVCEHAFKAGHLRRHPDGSRRLGLIRALATVLTGLRQPPSPLAARPDIEVPVEQAVVYWQNQRLASRHSPRMIVQWSMFLVSALAFAALGAWLWTPGFALLLLAVIALHEAGHWWAMRAFGYGNVQMLMLPLVGGVTIGHEQEPSARARAWISLMGPLPGIVLGVALFLAGVDIGDGWLWLAALLLLLVNLFNLLPILPLDGGHLLHLLLPERAASVRKLFDALAIIVLVLLAWSLHAWWLALLALVPFGNLRNAGRDHRLLAELRRVRAETPHHSESAAMAQTLALVCADVAIPATLAARIALAERTLSQARVQPMRRRRVVLLSALWLGCFAATATLPQVRSLLAPLLAPSWSAQQIESTMAALQADAQAMSTGALIESLAAMLQHDDASDPGPNAATDAQLAALERDLGQALPADWRTVLQAGSGRPLRQLLALGSPDQFRPLGQRHDCLALIEHEADWPGFASGKPAEFTLLEASTGESRQIRLEREKLHGWLTSGECVPASHVLRLLDMSDTDWRQWTLSLDEPFAVRENSLRTKLEQLHVGLMLQQRLGGR